MILLDASVVIDALRDPNSPLREVFITYDGAICGVTRAEVLHGARSSKDFLDLRASLEAFPQVMMPEELWGTIGLVLYSLRTAGVTVPLADAILATVAIEHDLELWTRDNHFAAIQKVQPALKLFEEPS
jgi:predicted nucleic acid-binding protein